MDLEIVKVSLIEVNNIIVVTFFSKWHRTSPYSYLLLWEPPTPPPLLLCLLFFLSIERSVKIRISLLNHGTCPSNVHGSWICHLHTCPSFCRPHGYVRHATRGLPRLWRGNYKRSNLASGDTYSLASFGHRRRRHTCVLDTTDCWNLGRLLETWAV